MRHATSLALHAHAEHGDHGDHDIDAGPIVRVVPTIEDTPGVDELYRVVQSRVASGDRACAADCFHRALAFLRLSNAAFAERCTVHEHETTAAAQIDAVASAARFPDVHMLMGLSHYVDDECRRRFGHPVPPSRADFYGLLDPATGRRLRRQTPKHVRDLVDATRLVTAFGIACSVSIIDIRREMGREQPNIAGMLSAPYRRILPEAGA